MKVKIKAYKPRFNNIIGHMSIETPVGNFYDITIRNGQYGEWLSAPSRAVEKDGKTTYYPYYHINKDLAKLALDNYSIGHEVILDFEPNDTPVPDTDDSSEQFPF